MKKLIIALTLLIASFAFAEHDHTPSKQKKEKFNFWWEQIPAVCSVTSEIERLAEYHNFNPVNVSVGRENGSQNGRVMYIVVYWINEQQETFASVTTPEDPETACIVFRTFDLKLNTDLLKGKKNI